MVGCRIIETVVLDFFSHHLSHNDFFFCFFDFTLAACYKAFGCRSWCEESEEMRARLNCCFHLLIFPIVVPQAGIERL